MPIPDQHLPTWDFRGGLLILRCACGRWKTAVDSVKGLKRTSEQIEREHREHVAEALRRPGVALA